MERAEREGSGSGGDQDGGADSVEFVLEDVQVDEGAPRAGQPAGDRRAAGPGRNLEQENENLKRALSESRARGRRLREQMSQDQARREEESRRASAARIGKPTEEDVRKLTEAEGIAEAAPTILEMARRQSDGQFLQLRESIATISQNHARDRHTDYDRVLDESGVRQALELGPDGRPRDPELFDRILLRAKDPGEDAYSLAQAILEEREGAEGRGTETERELPPATGSRAEGRREVYRELERTHARPRGIADAPAASGGRRRITFADIDQMSDLEFSRLPEDVRSAYLGKPPSR